MKRIGYIDARRVRYVVGGDTLFAVYSWGAVIASGSIYLASDYSAYINSPSAGVLDLAAIRINFRCGAAIRFWVNDTGFLSAYRGTLTGFIDISGGSLKLPMKSNPDPASREEGEIWYDTTSDKLAFKTAVGREVITSA